MTSNGNEPPFNDDELINDFYDEEDDFPEQYGEDDYMEEFGESEQVPNGNSNAAGDVGNLTAAQAQAEPTGIVIPRDGDGNGDGGENKEDSQENLGGDSPFEMNVDSAGVPSQVFLSTSREEVPTIKTNSDPYSFDRYNGGRKWRQKLSGDQNGEDAMTAVQWKRKDFAENSMSRSKSQLSSGKSTKAPEAQLVAFSTRYLKSSCTCIGEQSQRLNRFSIDANLPVENEDSVSITLGTGRMLHVRRRKEMQYAKSDLKPKLKDGSLLGVTMQQLIRRADAIERKNERKKRLRVCEDVQRTHGEILDEDEDENDIGICNKKSKRHSRNTEMDRLWIDKHAPAHFSDLLSDERINREVLRALRQWDPHVFGKKPPARPIIFQKYEDQRDEKKQDVANGGEERPDKRPDECNRVILLSGPPGIGKTTLAHIIAKHAGYRPLEVNASDERSASVLTERVQRAMESSTLNLKTLSGKDDGMAGRPNCLILDEIDGADARSSITALVNIIKAEKPAQGSKAKGRQTYLRRPIIFICNHKHAPALKPLLPYARKFDVLAPSPNRLVSRLKAVLAAERMTLVGGSSLLHKLTEAASGDIRSCLYTLQFASAKAKEIAAKNVGSKSSLVDISSTLNMALGANGNGMKDERSDMAGTLMTIFRRYKSRNNNKKSSIFRDVERVLGSVETFGDNSKTLDSLFMNVLNISYVDPTLDRCCAAHEWLSSSDAFRSYKSAAALTNSAEHRTMQKWHIPSAAAAVHLLCRVETRPDLIFSLRPLNDTIYELEANIGLVDKVLEGLPPSSKSGVSKNHFISDVLPYCLWLLSAGNGSGSLTRPVSSIDILTKEEKIAFDAHVDLLSSLGVTYVQDNDGESENSYPSSAINMRLEPEINKIATFNGITNKSRGVIPPLLKELLAHATKVAGMRDHDKVEMNSNDNTNENVTGQIANGLKHLSANNDGALPAESPSALTKKSLSIGSKKDSGIGGQKAVKKRSKAKSNFLGIGAAKTKAARNARKASMVSGSKDKVKLSNIGTGRPLDQVIRFKYQKGFTQAVRMPCNTSDLLL